MSKTAIGDAEDRVAIKELIRRNRIGLWTQDFDAYSSCFVHETTWRGGVRPATRASSCVKTGATSRVPLICPK